MNSNIQAGPADTGWRAEPATGADIITEIQAILDAAKEDLVFARVQMVQAESNLAKAQELVNAL